MNTGAGSTDPAPVGKFPGNHFCGSGSTDLAPKENPGNHVLEYKSMLQS